MTTIKNLRFAYKREPALFSALSLQLEDGSIYGLLGKNGVGKTTLLKIVGGLLFAQGGVCAVDGMDSRQRLPSMLEEIYLLPEEFDIPPLSPRVYRQLYGPLYPRFDDQLFVTCLREFDLESQRPLTRMSYGQRKKFLVAFGLATDCRLLLLDEPTNGLDIPSKSQFRRLVAGAVSDHRTFLISTHQVRDMQNLIDPIIILEDGQIIFQADTFRASEKLAVITQTNEPGPSEALYAEKTPGGYAIIRERVPQDEPAQIDLELLFNAVVAEPQKVATIFAKEESV